MPVSHADASIDALIAALQAGDATRAESIVHQMDDPLPQDLLQPVGEVYIERGRYADAVRLLNRVIDRTPVTRVLANLAKNLRALEVHRPEVHRQVTAADLDTQRFQLAAAADDDLTVMALRPGQQPLSLSPANRPKKGAADALAALAEAIKNDQPLSLTSIGDGYVLAALADLPPDPMLGMESVVHLIEPDAALLRMALMLHDFSGPDGPIARRRYHWWVGPDWDESMQSALTANAYLPVPAVHVRQGLEPAPIVQRIEQMITTIARQAMGAQQRIDAHYEAVDLASLAERVRGRGDRPPRVLLTTTRFTTVLQYSTADVAAAFEKLGWETQLAIEPDRDQRITLRAIREAVDQFRPDLVFQIDHLRSELDPPIFPDNLLFVGWVQDHLPNLTRRAAGASIKPTDFILTSARRMYEQRYRYPASQIIDLAKLTREVDAAAIPEPDVPTTDIAFVSHASLTTDQMWQRLIEAMQHSLLDRAALRELFDRLVDLYADDRSLGSAYALGRFIDETLGEIDPADRNTLRRVLVHPVDDALYRQQALRWTIDIADELGLSVALYGKGWERHPDFAAYARGPLQYGDQLQAVTRATPINLQITPNCCLHQRLLDGLAADGFFLVRRHSTDTLLPRLGRFVAEHLPTDAEDVPAARAAIADNQRQALEQLLSDCRQLSILGEDQDPIAFIRSVMRMRLLDGQQRLLPRLEEICFNSRSSLRHCVQRFATDADARRDLAAVQKQSVLDRLTYRAGMARVIEQIADRVERGLRS